MALADNLAVIALNQRVLEHQVAGGAFADREATASHLDHALPSAGFSDPEKGHMEHRE